MIEMLFRTVMVDFSNPYANTPFQHDLIRMSNSQLFSPL